MRFTELSALMMTSLIFFELWIRNRESKFHEVHYSQWPCMNYVDSYYDVILKVANMSIFGRTFRSIIFDVLLWFGSIFSIRNGSDSYLKHKIKVNSIFYVKLGIFHRFGREKQQRRRLTRRSFFFCDISEWPTLRCRRRSSLFLLCSIF